MKDIEKEIRDLKARCIANRFLNCLTIGIVMFLWGSYTSKPKTDDRDNHTGYYLLDNSDSRRLNHTPNPPDSIVEPLTSVSIKNP